MYKAKYFDIKEFACQGDDCCGNSHPISETLLKALDSLRFLLGRPIIVTSGFRCRKHNSTVSKHEDSFHTMGIAADIKVPGLSPAQVAEKAKQIPAFKDGGIGIYSSWIHVDVRGEKARW